MMKKSTKSSKKAKIQEAIQKENEAKKIIKTANEVGDVLESFAAFKKFDRNGIDVILEYFPIQKLSDELFEWIFSLFCTNMKSIYEGSWGWDERKKREEMREEDAKYIVAFDRQTKNAVAFLAFRFIMEDDLRLVAYCYEIQVSDVARGKGLGKFMMQILELVGKKNGMNWAMLTTLKNNIEATKFYTKHLNYKVDESSPELCDPKNASTYTYQILSKLIGKPSS
eukprot:TRINITY_DN22128_c0_g1_i1.p1 TRINITY_DN22128_c0_g1~~TRINITY_DN22128_c0_g1_i1.p1  ORF type:complete len:225 (-),score=46.78 TRINITY_DN22128_c0_g1_i1:31-705(-)